MNSLLNAIVPSFHRQVLPVGNLVLNDMIACLFRETD
jgi:hypothetical protein